MATGTSSSLFLSLLWSIQDPKQQTEQSCTFSIQRFSLLKEWTGRNVQGECASNQHLHELYWLFYSSVTICYKTATQCKLLFKMWRALVQIVNVLCHKIRVAPANNWITLVPENPNWVKLTCTILLIKNCTHIFSHTLQVLKDFLCFFLVRRTFRVISRPIICCCW